ncbi:MAG TPA: UvrD-helicase domain-containing protein [Symbiobacteriaceae bacterium]|nr:UvrD-helicase domain-containing protein [Symbiobacteriaceae bacterium]
MGVETHPAYSEEARRLRGTLGEVKSQLTELRAIPPLNMPELVDDAMISMLAAEMALERIRLEKIRRLDLAEREPYFGRIDFQEAGTPEAVPLYIGKVGVARAADNQPEVIDWRAPVAGLFYTSATGGSDEATYDAPEGAVKGVLWLKRNIGVKQSRLQRIVDAKVKGAPEEAEPILDEFLRYRLQESRDSRLRDIVSTIQSEQNAIIRAPLDRPLIIQGVAGSGKTTVALHRLAYLLYTFRETILASRIVIFAPSRMFLDYIGDVLPELGVDGVVQTTFADWAMGELEEPVTLTDAGARYEHLFAPGKDPGEGADAPGRFKGSLLFQQVLDFAVAEYEEQFVPRADLELWPGAVLRHEEVLGWFHENYRLWPVMARKERCLARAKKWAEDRLIPFIGGMNEKERRKTMRAALQRWIKLWPAHSTVELYRQILGAKPSRKATHAHVGHPDIPPRVITESLAVFKRDEVAPEDLAPLVYLKGRLRGYKEDRQLDHVVIDEAQDFSPFQVDLLRNLTRENSFTILGDLSQGIHAYAGIHRWDEFMECFEPNPVAYFTLEQSYRSTFEVMSFANQVISTVGAPAALAKPVFRSGEPVQVKRTSALPESIAAAVAELRGRNHASIAVIGRTEAQCRELHHALVELGLEAELITPRQTTYRGGLSVMPAYLTKGLEFDAVIVAGADAEAYRATLRDAKLLYVACTRALHELILFHGEKPSPLLGNV